MSESPRAVPDASSRLFSPLQLGPLCLPSRIVVSGQSAGGGLAASLVWQLSGETRVFYVRTGMQWLPLVVAVGNP